MSQPQWVTPVGSLGTLPQSVFYSVQLQTTNAQSGQTVKYVVISGLLPAGMFIDEAGLIAGTPRAVVDIAGVPVEVSQDVTSKFAIRAFTEKTVGSTTVVDAFNDRTFTITVSGAGAPQWITPAGEIAEYFVGTLITDLAVYYTDANTSDTVTVSLFSGELPPGTTISDTGVFGGYIGLNPSYPGVTTGYDATLYDEYPFDFTQEDVTYTYQFTLAVTNGFSTDLRTFEITALSRSIFTADTTLISADTTLFTADVSNLITPFIITPVGTIGTVRSDNYFAFQFQAVDVYGNTLGWRALSPLPPGLTLDLYTGYLYGDIPDLGLTDLTYGFYIQTYEIGDPTIESNPYFYSLTIQGALANNITWITPSDLGSIDNGGTSTFYVEAVDTLDAPLLYRIKSGSSSRLPQGLTLEPNGDIVGRVSFQTFTLDHGTTTFDVADNNPYYNVNGVPTTSSQTTFDLTYTFTVEAYSVDPAIDVFQTFTILVNRKYNEPYENLYIKAMPPFTSRALISSLVNDPTIFTPDFIYRSDDPNFGVAKFVQYWHAYGLTATTYENYVSALALNHYWKNLTLGAIKTARAVDPVTEETIYEVVYCEIVDNLINDLGVSVSKDVVLPYPPNAGTVNEIDTVYPNALVDMRQQVIDTVGQVSNVLPLWMQSKQTTGQILGFTPAWVIAYCQPTTANEIAYNIQTRFTGNLNQFDFKVDRYELDRALTHNWKPPATYPIANIVGNGSNATVSITPAYAEPFYIGEEVGIANVTPSVYNGNSFTVDNFTYGNVNVVTTTSNVYVSGGNISNYGRWLPYPPQLTTFDVDAHYQFANVAFANVGNNYAVTNQVVIRGNVIGGITPENDTLVTVNTVGNIGNIQGAFVSGFATLPLVGQTYPAVSGITLTGNGVGATFNIAVVPGVATIFDGGSTQIIDPSESSDTSSTNIFDKYLVFPKRNILQ